MQLYDMHSHILPKFDDGARSVEVALELIEALKAQGITNICLTPHFYSNHMSAEDYVAKRDAAFESFRRYIPEDVNVVLGSEVFVTEYLFHNDNLSGVTYGRSNYILTEFAYDCKFTERIMQRFNMLCNNYRLIPVFPHVERYSYLMDHPDVIAELQDMGVIIQTNVSNYTPSAPFFRKRKLLKLISNGYIDILGSDTHSMTHNPPGDFKIAMDTISAKCGRSELNRLMRNAKRIFEEAAG